MFELCDDDFRKVVSIDGKDIGSFVYSSYATKQINISNEEYENIDQVVPNCSDGFLLAYDTAKKILQRPLVLEEIKTLDYRKYYKDKVNYISKAEIEELMNKYDFDDLKTYNITFNKNMSLNAFNTAFKYVTSNFTTRGKDKNDVLRSLPYYQVYVSVTQEEYEKAIENKKRCYKIEERETNNVYYYVDK